MAEEPTPLDPTAPLLDQVEDRIAEILDPGLDEPGLVALRHRAAASPQCMRRIEAHRRLAQDLRRLPDAPPFEVPLPALPPAAPSSRSLPRRAIAFGPGWIRPGWIRPGWIRPGWIRTGAAAAAVLLAVGGVSYLGSPRGGDTRPESVGTPVLVSRVVTVEDGTAGGSHVGHGPVRIADDHLLGLTAGWEAVASRRPTEVR